MANLSILVVDDEPLARGRLSKLISSLDGYSLCAEAENGNEAVAACLEHAPDIVLMDIRMPEKDGLEAAAELDQLDPAPAIIFCTAYDEHAIEAFKLNAVDYLLKPVRKADLEAALGRSRTVTQSQLKAIAGLDEPIAQQAIVANTWNGKEIIALEDLFYIVAEDKYLRIEHRAGSTVSDQTLKELEQQFSDALVRAHRNALVNGRHIKAISKSSSGAHFVTFNETPDTVNVSRRAYAAILEYLEKQS